MGQVIYVDEQGQQIAAPAQQLGQQVIYVDEQGQQIVDPMMYVPAPVPSMVQHMQAGPSVYTISPEQFAQLAQGGTLSQEQINGMMGLGPVAAEPGLSVSAGAAPAEPQLVSAEQAVGITPTPAPMPGATTAAAAAGSKKKKSKALSSKKKKSKGCC